MDTMFYYLLLSLGGNVFFFACIFFQHMHIENEHDHNRALGRQVEYWKEKVRGQRNV